MSIRRRMRARHRYNESPSGSSPSSGGSRRLAHSPIQKSLEHDTWAHNSKGIRIAMELKDNGVISEKELQDIVQGDKRFYTHNPSTLVQSGAEKDNTCPISLQPLQNGPGRTIAIMSPKNANVFVRYDTLSLADYILDSGSRVDPIQRREYTDEELQRIDSTVKLCTETTGSPSRKSVVMAVNDSKTKQEKAFLSTALYGLDNLIAELIGEIFNALENGVAVPGALLVSHSSEKPTDAPPPAVNIAQETYAHFLMYILPNFSYLFGQMMESDVGYAQHCLEQYISRLKGPPNRPTEDKHNLLPRILDAFKSKQLGKKAIEEKKLEKEKKEKERASNNAAEEKRPRATSADSIMDVPV